MDVSIDDFRAKGYQIFRDVVASDRVSTVKSYLQQQEFAAIRTLEPLGIRAKQPHLGSDVAKLLASSNADKIDRDLRATMTGHFPLNVRLSEVLWAIPKDPHVQELLRSILDAAILHMHMPPTARFVLPGNNAAGVPAHQDISYNRHMTSFVTMWVPLVDIDSLCGGITIFEAKHTGEIPTKLGMYGMWNDAVDTTGLTAVNCVPMRPGDVLVFNNLLIHQSMPNLSNNTRFSIDYRFFGDLDTSQKHYLDMQSWQVVAPTQQSIGDRT